VSSGGRRAWLWPVLAAILLRLACLPLGARIVPSGDAVGYIKLAQDFRASGEFNALAQGVRPPLFRVLLAPGVGTTGVVADAFPGAYLIQIGMDVLALVLLVQLTRRRFGDHAALAAGWIYALLPQAVLYSSVVIMAETVAVLAVAAALLALDGLDRALDRPGAAIAPRVLLLGAVLGLGILTKELLVPVTGVFLLALLLRPRPAPWRRAGLVLATAGVAGLVVAPWAAWTAQHYGVPILSGTHGDMSMGVDNPPPGQTSMRYFKELYIRDVKDQLDYSHAVFHRALVEYPALTAERAVMRMRIAAGPEDVLPIWIAMAFDGYVPDASSNFALSRQAWVLPPHGWGRRLQLLGSACAVAFFALAAAGLASVRRDLLRTVALLALAVILLTLALTVASPRYRQSMVPFLLPFAGLAAARLLDALRGQQTQQHGARRAATCGLAVAVLLTVTMFCLPAP